MSAGNDGGPAFPATLAATSHEAAPILHPGMTLRDQVAIRAMQSMLTRSGFYGQERELGRAAYRCADAMLAARDQTP
jgi:hypothetical protein